MTHNNNYSIINNYYNYSYNINAHNYSTICTHDLSNSYNYIHGYKLH